MKIVTIVAVLLGVLVATAGAHPPVQTQQILTEEELFALTSPGLHQQQQNLKELTLRAQDIVFNNFLCARIPRPEWCSQPSDPPPGRRPYLPPLNLELAALNAILAKLEEIDETLNRIAAALDTPPADYLERSE